VAGHSLHPLLTDLPLGAWTSALVLDLLGGESAEQAADRLVGLGIAASLPTAAAGLSDWSDTLDEDRRIGFAHALLNAAALAAFTASFAARRTGHRGAGKLLGLMGAGSLFAGSYLGGHLSYSRGIGVNQTALEDAPGEWTAVCGEDELSDGEPKRVGLGQIAVLLVREGGRVHALSNRCTHLSGPLNEGEIADGCVTCPWHASRFRLEDGAVVRGPATDPQPVYATRIRAGKIEIRQR